MDMPLPSPPHIDHWSHAVRSAEVLRGSLVRCGPGVRLAGWPDSPRVRAAALIPWLQRDRVAVEMTAAWVWGAARTPGPCLEVSTSHNHRVDIVIPPGLHVHQFRFKDDDICSFGAASVASPARVLFDLLRTPRPFDLATRIACRLLIMRDDVDRAVVGQRFQTGARPFRAIALDRLALL